MAQSDPNRLVFKHDVFEVPSLEIARRVTLTNEGGMTTDQRWERETPYLIDDVGKFLPIQPESVVLDYGCGPGRMSKGLIERYACRAIGVDTSQSMRLLAPEYVMSERFTTWSPELLERMLAKGFRADFCVCTWVIQHAFDAMDVISRINRTLRPGGLLYAMNQQTRCVPTNKGYANDGFDVPGALASTFHEEHRGALPTTVAPDLLARQSVIQVLRKKAS